MIWERISRYLFPDAWVRLAATEPRKSGRYWVWVKPLKGPGFADVYRWDTERRKFFGKIGALERGTHWQPLPKGPGKFRA